MTVVKKPYKPTEIEIRNISRFSYGEMNDGTVALWAEGAAGWFQIAPAPHYRAIFDSMIAAVQILYFVTDIYKEPRKRGGGPSAQLIFQEVRGATTTSYKTAYSALKRSLTLTLISTQKTDDSRATTLRQLKPYSTSTMSFS